MSGELGDPSSVLPGNVVPDFASWWGDALEFVRATMSEDKKLKALPFLIAGHSMGTYCLVFMAVPLQNMFGARFCGICFSAFSVPDKEFSVHATCHMHMHTHMHVHMRMYMQ